MLKLCVDPGHGGKDPGAVGGKLKEKDLTLAISKELARILENEYSGVDVLLTRTNDVYLSLTQRARKANAWGADFFLSIHINAGGGTGVEVFSYLNAKSSTKRVQKILQKHLVKDLSARDRGCKEANFGVLRMTKMSALLSENLFIDNATDYAKLAKSDFYKVAARAHAKAIAEAFDLRKKVAPAPNPKPENQTGSGLFVIKAGAFKDKANAEKRLAEVKKVVPDAYIDFEE